MVLVSEEVDDLPCIFFQHALNTRSLWAGRVYSCYALCILHGDLHVSQSILSPSQLCLRVVGGQDASTSSLKSRLFFGVRRRDIGWDVLQSWKWGKVWRLGRCRPILSS